MTRSFIELPQFRYKWKALGLNDNDYCRLQNELLADPKVGDVIRGTGGIRKMRFAFEHRSKTDSTRIIYIDFEVYEEIYLLTAYAKNEQSNLTEKEKNELRRLVSVIEQQLEEKD